MIANYLIFHPEAARQLVYVNATVMINKTILTNWYGNIWVDKIGRGNEDPFVFDNPWLYSYCHASQLRRNIRNDSYLQIGSKIIFASGEKANRNEMTIDTIFLIGDIHTWTNKPSLQLPSKYQSILNKNNSDLWMRHFRFPFMGFHNKVSKTYEADLWQKCKNEYSYLPLDKTGERVSIPFDKFSVQLKNKIKHNVKGKYPVLLSEEEVKNILTIIENETKTKVLKNITEINQEEYSENAYCCK